eukprot:c20705_g2_i1.p1 GENE.c20705_g2_i1~~c20705_g2_i1.p1  ORF type:complete len:170 (-),score=39.43 c20705_g2_i1:9-518(-)
MIIEIPGQKPIHSLIYHNQNYLMANMDGVFFARDHKFENLLKGPCTSISKDPKSGLILFSFRSTSEKKAEHLILRVSEEGECEILKTFQGHQSQLTLSKSFLFSSSSNISNPKVASGDELTDKCNIWDFEGKREILTCQHPSHILDVCTDAKGLRLASLCSEELHLHSL